MERLALEPLKNPTNVKRYGQGEKRWRCRNSKANLYRYYHLAAFWWQTYQNPGENLASAV